MSEPSAAERIAERVGYVLGAVLFGPGAALDVRARRIIRRAAAAYCEPLEAARLVTPRRVVGRAIKLPAAAGPIPVEIRVDVRDRRAELSAAIQTLPSYVKATITRDPGALHGVRLRLTPALATIGTMRVVSETLDVEAAAALLASVAEGPLDRVAAFELAIASAQLRAFVLAPTSVDEWSRIGGGIVRLTEWLAAKWPESYR